MLNRVTLDVVATNHPDVLARVVMLLHRLTIDVRSLSMQRPKQGRRMTLTIEIELRSEETDRIKANLSKIPYVVSVKQSTAQSR